MQMGYNIHKIMSPQIFCSLFPNNDYSVTIFSSNLLILWDELNLQWIYESYWNYIPDAAVKTWKRRCKNIEGTKAILKWIKHYSYEFKADKIPPGVNVKSSWICFGIGPLVSHYSFNSKQ